MTILVTGAAGYIGSVVLDALCAHGEHPVALDDLSHGHRDAVDPAVPFHHGAMGDRALVAHLVRRHHITACVHLAAYTSVGESVACPETYYANNLAQGIALVETLAAEGVRHIVASSTAAVYGHPRTLPIPEDHPLQPASPYGWTKRALEDALARVSHQGSLGWVALRYFNAAGATVTRAERHEPETHLIPLCLRAAAGVLPAVTVHGTDHPTPDGTAVRDYVHVSDLADAHLRALAYLRNGGPSVACNLGAGTGASVRDVVASVQRVTGRRVPTVDGPRRPGDPAVLVADPTRAGRILGWRAEASDLDAIVRSAWAHHTTV